MALLIVVTGFRTIIGELASALLGDYMENVLLNSENRALADDHNYYNHYIFHTARIYV